MSTKHLDRPIQTSADDILGRKDFAEQTATLFKNWKGNDSLVVALYGEWGSGKSSIKNLIIDNLSPIQSSEKIVEIIQKHLFDVYKVEFNYSVKRALQDSASKRKIELNLYMRPFSKDPQIQEWTELLLSTLDSPIIVEFNPWEWASQDVIVEAFFNQLIKKIGRKDKKLGKLLIKYKNALNGVNAIISVLSSNLTTIASFIMLVGGLSAHQYNEWLSIILSTLGGGLLMAEKLFVALLPWFKSEIKNAEEIKKEIGLLLSKQDTPTIIILDDLDRLTAEQIKTVMQLVKVNADFPNTIFFLLYQKDIVEKKLIDNGTQDGSLYMEKIINLPLNMPKILLSSIYEFVLNGVKDVFPKYKFNEDYAFKRVWKDIACFYLTDIRIAKRFLLTVKFYTENFKDTKGNLRINIGHLLILEVLRMKEIKLFNYIALNDPAVLSKKTEEELEKIFDWEKDTKKLPIMIKLYLYLFSSDDVYYNKTQLVSDKEVHKLYFSLQPHDFIYLDKENFKNITQEELSDYVGSYQESDKNKEWQDYLWNFIESIFTSMSQDSQTYSLVGLQTLSEGNAFCYAKETFIKLFYKLSEKNQKQFLLSFDQNMVNDQLVALVSKVAEEDENFVDRYNSLMSVWLKKDPKHFWQHLMYVQLWKDRDKSYMDQMSGWIKNDSNSDSLVYLLTGLQERDRIAQHNGQIASMFSTEYLEQYVGIDKLKKKIKILSNEDPALKENEIIKLFHQYIK